MSDPVNVTTFGHVESLKNDFTMEDLKKIEPGDIVFFGSEAYEETSRIHADTVVTIAGTVLHLDDLRHPFTRKGEATERPHTLKRDHYKKITDEEFKSIAIGDYVYWGRRQYAKVTKLLNDAVITTGSKKISKIAMEHPFFTKGETTKKETLQEQTAPKMQQETPVKKTVQTPKPKTGLQRLIEKYPAHKDLINFEFVIPGATLDQVEGVVLMQQAAKAARQ